MKARDTSNDKLILEAGKKLLSNGFSARTFERLLCAPREAMRFCQAVRKEMGVSKVIDEDILWLLLNQRKQGLLKTGRAPKSDAD